MNALIYAINEVNCQIPNEVLYAGMTLDEDANLINLNSLDDKILRKVLRKRVLVDCNVVGGIETMIALNQIQPSFYELYYTVYKVPAEVVMNKEIISALSLAYMPGGGYSGFGSGYNGGVNNGGTSMSGFNSYNPVMNVADRIGNAASSTGVLSNAHIEIVAYNTLLVYANYRTLTNFGVKVVLENDINMNNIPVRSYKNFGFLCVLGVKAYLYNKLIVAINSGYLSSGQDLGVFKSILEGYADCEEQYRTYLKEVWGATAFMADTSRYNRFLSSMLSSGL